LALAIARGIPESGLAFAIAMLVGVAITLSALVVSRKPWPAIV
jgi:ABC-type nickel/cobalt efflux system permease component RcnA